MLEVFSINNIAFSQFKINKKIKKNKGQEHIYAHSTVRVTTKYQIMIA